MRHVEGDRDIGVHAVCGGRGAARADLLLDGCRRNEIARRAARLGELLEHADGHPHAHLVVEGARNRHVLAEALVADAERDRVADPHELLDLLARHSEVDHELVDRRDVLALVGFDEVDRLASDDAAQGAGVGVHVNTQSGQDRRVDASDGRHGQIAVVGDVGDHQADLVHMRGEHQRGPVGVALKQGVHRAHDIGADLVCGAGKALAHHVGDGNLVSGGRGRLKQLLEESFVLGLHYHHSLRFARFRSGLGARKSSSICSSHTSRVACLRSTLTMFHETALLP